MQNIIGAVPFIDGVLRDVYYARGGIEYFLNEDGRPIYGNWSHLDGPEIIAWSETLCLVNLGDEHVGAGNQSRRAAVA